MIGYWIAFWVIFGFVPLNGIIILADKKLQKFAGLDKLKTHEKISKIIGYIFVFWIFDLLYMAIFNNWLIWIFIIGGFIVLASFIGIASTFVKSIENKKIPAKELFFQLLLVLALTVYLIYIIPNEKLQTIILTTMASVYGGFITLLGVAWTIKTTDRNRHHDLVLNAMPIFGFEEVLNNETPKDITKVCSTNKIENNFFKCVANVIIENSILNAFRFFSVLHDGIESRIHGNYIVLPNSKHFLTFYFNNLNDIVLKVADNNHNFHYYKLELYLASLTSTHYTVREITPLGSFEVKELAKKKKAKLIKVREVYK